MFYGTRIKASFCRKMINKIRMCQLLKVLNSYPHNVIILFICTPLFYTELEIKEKTILEIDIVLQL